MHYSFLLGAFRDSYQRIDGLPCITDYVRCAIVSVKHKQRSRFNLLRSRAIANEGLCKQQGKSINHSRLFFDSKQNNRLLSVFLGTYHYDRDLQLALTGIQLVKGPSEQICINRIIYKMPLVGLRRT